MRHCINFGLFVTKMTKINWMMNVWNKPVIVSLACYVTRTSMTQSRSFAIVGPSIWNKLPQSLRDLVPISSNQFRKYLKTSLFISEDNDPGRERLWFKWRDINVGLRIRRQLFASCVRPHELRHDYIVLLAVHIGHDDERACSYAEFTTIGYTIISG